ncbi:MAG: integration host factor subunit beta [Bdellovibrionales bacterium]|nr:integration host factor subunit beta [Bdellovibrionales bacterium]
MKEISTHLKKRSKLIEELAKKNNIKTKVASLYVNTIIEEMTKALKEDKRIELRGFGTFGVKKLKSYIGKNPKNQQQITVPAKKKIWFKSHLFK